MQKLALLALLVLSCACGPVTSAEARTFRCNAGHPQYCSTPGTSPSPSPASAPSPLPSPSPASAPSPSPSPSPAPVPAPGGAPQPLGQSGSWNLIFSDEFGGAALDR